MHKIIVRYPHPTSDHAVAVAGCPADGLPLAPTNLIDIPAGERERAAKAAAQSVLARYEQSLDRAAPALAGPAPVLLAVVGVRVARR